MICVPSIAPGKDPGQRPKQFQTRDGDGLILFVLQRVGPEGPVDPGPRDATLAGFEVIQRDYERAELRVPGRRVSSEDRRSEAKGPGRETTEYRTVRRALPQAGPGAAKHPRGTLRPVLGRGQRAGQRAGQEGARPTGGGSARRRRTERAGEGAECGPDVAGITTLAAGPARAPAGRAEPGRSGVCRTPHLGLPELLPERVARGAPRLRRGRRPPRRSLRRQPRHPELLRVPRQRGRPQPELGPQVRAASPHDRRRGTAIDGCCAWRSSRWRRS